MNLCLLTFASVLELRQCLGAGRMKGFCGMAESRITHSLPARVTTSSSFTEVFL